MKFYQPLFKLCLIVFLGLASVSLSLAAELHVITSGAFSEALKALAPKFEEATGHTVKLSFGSSMGESPEAIPNRVARGEVFDVMILARSSLDKFADEGSVIPDTRVNLAGSTIGAAVREGHPGFDISTIDALKQSLLTAKSVAYSASASGTYISTEMLKALGVEAEVLPKSTKVIGERVGTIVARGEAELGFQQVSELISIPGIRFIGELPAEVQKTTYFSAGVMSNSQQEVLAKQLIQFLASEQVASIIKETGMHPTLAEMPWKK